MRYALIALGLVASISHINHAAADDSESVHHKFNIVLSPTGSGPDARGELEMREEQEGIRLLGRIQGLPKGRFGFHIHEKGSCAARGEAAGPHFNPSGAPHGAPGASERHAGDLGNIEATGSGTTLVDIQDKVLKTIGLKGIKGRTIVLHGRPDDLKSQPSGSAGPRIACGIIE